MGQARLSVIIITKNEALNIEACLDSLTWADEIIIVDSGSTDQTVELSKKYTSMITVTPDWPGYGIQKQRALDQATGDWVLSLDADERVSPELQKEIQTHLQSSDKIAYKIPFISFYCGKKIRFGDWGKESHIRLFRRSKSHFSSTTIHEDLVFTPKLQAHEIGTFKSPVYHYSYPEISTVLKKLNDYSTLGALKKFQQNRRATIGTAIMRSLWCFLRGYIFRLGFLDGREGFMLAVSNAEGTYYRYLKLIYLNLNQKTPLNFHDS